MSVGLKLSKSMQLLVERHDWPRRKGNDESITLRNSTEYEPTGLQAMNVTKITSNQIWNESWQFHFFIYV